MSSQKHAVLGLVIERPGYGYDIAARVQERCLSWEWAPSGVYGVLDALAKDELVRVLGESVAEFRRREQAA